MRQLQDQENTVADLTTQLSEAQAAAAEAQRQREAQAAAAAAKTTTKTKSSTTTTVAAASNSGSASGVVSAAYSMLGVPYVWGGTSPLSGFDCSGVRPYHIFQTEWYFRAAFIQCHSRWWLISRKPFAGTAGRYYLLSGPCRCLHR